MKKIIVVHGAQALHSKHKLLQNIISWLYKNLFNYEPTYLEDSEWVPALSQKYDTSELTWSGKVRLRDIQQASIEIETYLKSNTKNDTIFITKSLGTEIVLRALDKENFTNVKGVISICPVNKPRDFKSFKFTSIRSSDDLFGRFAIKFLWPSKFFSENTGLVDNIVLDNVRHDQFVPDQKINKDYTLEEFVIGKIENV